MAKKTVEAEVKMTDSTAAGAAGIAASAEKVGKAFTAMDRAVAKAAADAMKERQRAERTLMEQKIANLRREEDLGNKRAGVVARELEMTMRLKRERQDLLRIINAEHTSMAQRIVAQQRLNQLQAQSATFIAAAGRGGAATGGGMMGGFRGLAAFGGAYLAMAKMQQFATGIEDLAKQAVKFEESIKDLSSIGGNAKALGTLRADVLSRSVAFGRTPEDVAGFMFNIQTGTAGMAPEIVRAIETTTLRLGQVVGGDLALIGDAVATAVRQFNLSAQDAGDRMFLAAERGKISVSELARLAPRVLPVARTMGFSPDETFAAIATATKFGGRPEEAITGLRNMMLRFQNVEGATGRASFGNLTERLEGLKGINTETMSKIFGARTVATVISLRDNIADLRKELELAGNVAGTVGSRIADRFKDATVRMTEMAKAIEQLKNAGGVVGGQGLLEFQNRVNLAQTQTYKNPANPGGMVAGMVLPDWLQKLESAGNDTAAGMGYVQLAEEFARQGNKAMFEEASRRAKELLPNNKPGNRYRYDVLGRRTLRTADQPFLEGEDEATDARNRLNFIASQYAARQAKEAQEAAATAQAKQAARDARAQRILGFASTPGSELTPQQRAMLEPLMDDDAALARAEAMAARGRARGASFFQQKAMEDSLRGLFDFRLGKETNAEGISMALRNLFGNFGQGNIFTGEKGSYGALPPLLGEKIGEGIAKAIGQGNFNFLSRFLSRGFEPRKGPAAAGAPELGGAFFEDFDNRAGLRDALRGNRPDGAGQVLSQFFRGFAFQGQDDKALDKKVDELVAVAKAQRDAATELLNTMRGIGAF